MFSLVVRLPFLVLVYPYSLQRRYNALNCGIGFDAEGAGFEPANAATRHRNLNPAELSATQALRCGAGSGEDASLRPRFSAPDRAPFARASRDSSRPPLRGRPRAGTTNGPPKGPAAACLVITLWYSLSCAHPVRSAGSPVPEVACDSVVRYPISLRGDRPRPPVDGH
jgi:hypothetical protein